MGQNVPRNILNCTTDSTEVADSMSFLVGAHRRGQFVSWKQGSGSLQNGARHRPGLTTPPAIRRRVGPSPRLKGSGREDARSYTASAMRFTRALLLCCLTLCPPAATQPIPTDDEAVKNLVRNRLSKIASPSIYSFAFEIAPTYAPGQQAEVFVLRWKNEVAACIDEMQSGWEWLIRAEPRLDLIDGVGWDSSSQPKGCASFLDGVRSARYRQTHDEQDKRMRRKARAPRNPP